MRNRLPLAAVAEQVLRYSQFPRSPAARGAKYRSARLPPGFADEPFMWSMTMYCRATGSPPTHVDEWNNIGCVIAGRRRFTLFPPEQIANLRNGPPALRAHRGADSSGVATAARLDTLPSSARHWPHLRWPRWPGRRRLHSAPVVAPRRIARAVQRVGGTIGGMTKLATARWRIRLRGTAARYPGYRRPAASPRVAWGAHSRSLRVRREGWRERSHSRATARCSGGVIRGTIGRAAGAPGEEADALKGAL